MIDTGDYIATFHKNGSITLAPAITPAITASTEEYSSPVIASMETVIESEGTTTVLSLRLTCTFRAK